MTPKKTTEIKYTLTGEPMGEVLFNNVAYIPKVHTMNTLIERLEGMKEDGETPFGSQELHETDVAYNQALTEAQNIIKNLTRE